jgi:hypothetical protein
MTVDAELEAAVTALTEGRGRDAVSAIMRAGRDLRDAHRTLTYRPSFELALLAGRRSGRIDSDTHDLVCWAIHEFDRLTNPLPS